MQHKERRKSSKEHIPEQQWGLVMLGALWDMKDVPPNHPTGEVKDWDINTDSRPHWSCI